MKISKEDAKNLILKKQGLSGEYKFHGYSGMLDFIKQAGCVQYDPLDRCGKTHEITLHSRVLGFTKDLLYEALYDKRDIIDYFDKNMAIFSIYDWPFFARRRLKAREERRSHSALSDVKDVVIEMIDKRGPLSSTDIDLPEKLDWSWNETRLARAILETLYLEGELIVHHKNNTKKYYDLAKNHMPRELLRQEDPHKKDLDYMKWSVLRRIGATGMLWNKSSDAFLGIVNYSADLREQAFKSLLDQGSICEITVDSLKEPLYIKTSELSLLENNDFASARTEFIAPLDNFIWDRNLIQELFEFRYRWEVYTPAKSREYGYYVLPVLSGNRFIARAEVVNDKKRRVLILEDMWWEKGIEKSKYKEKIEECLERFSKFNGCQKIEIKSLI